MTTASPFGGYAARLRVFIEGASAGYSGAGASFTSGLEGSFSRLALDLFALQFLHNPAYRRLCGVWNIGPDTVRDWREIPILPTSAFKELDLTSLPLSERTVVFHSSGTTEQRPSRHFHDGESLALYEASLLPWFRFHLLSGAARTKQNPVPVEAKPVVVSLTPGPVAAPHSSLVHMFDCLRNAFGSPDSNFVGRLDPCGAWDIDLLSLRKALSSASSTERPVILVGTAFNFVHLLDAASLDAVLPPGSSILETGGYKGRSRTMPKAELHRLVAQRFGVPLSRIVTEYGMSELSSQAYDCVADSPGAADPTRRVFRFPPWARALVVSPESGREVADGETGLVRVYDLANVRSVLAVQTEDLAIRRADGFELIGRAAHALPRGCSLMAV